MEFLLAQLILNWTGTLNVIWLFEIELGNAGKGAALRAMAITALSRRGCPAPLTTRADVSLPDAEMVKDRIAVPSMPLPRAAAGYFLVARSLARTLLL